MLLYQTQNYSKSFYVAKKIADISISDFLE